MTFVITSHWPHPVVDDLPYHIYRHELNKTDEKLAVGDGVLFYEGEHRDGVKVATRRVDRVETPGIRLRSPSKGLIAVGRIIAERRRIQPTDVVYNYGDLERWEWLYPCEVYQYGDVPNRDVKEIIEDNRPAYTYGLREITESQFLRLEALLRGER